MKTIAVIATSLVFGATTISFTHAQQISEPVAVANFAWHQLSPATSRCVSAQLAQNGLSIRYLVDRAILPSDSRVQPLVSQCSEREVNNDQRPVRQRQPAIGNYFPDNSAQAPAPRRDAGQQPSPQPAQTIAPVGIEAQRQAREAEQARHAEEVRKANEEGRKFGLIWLFGGALITILAIGAVAAIRIRQNRSMDEVRPSFREGLKMMTLADWTGPLFVFVLALSVPLALVVASVPSVIARALGVLLVPAAFFFWIGATMRALHQADLRFWKMSSTWGLLIFALASFLIALLGNGLIALATHGETTSPTLTVASAIVLGGALIWAIWYNSRSTGNMSLAISLAAVQMISGLAIVGAIWFLVFGRGEDGRPREGPVS